MFKLSSAAVALSELAKDVSPCDNPWFSEFQRECWRRFTLLRTMLTDRSHLTVFEMKEVAEAAYERGRPRHPVYFHHNGIGLTKGPMLRALPEFDPSTCPRWMFRGLPASAPLAIGAGRGASSVQPPSGLTFIDGMWVVLIPMPAHGLKALGCALVAAGNPELLLGERNPARQLRALKLRRQEEGTAATLAKRIIASRKEQKLPVLRETTSAAAVCQALVDASGTSLVLYLGPEPRGSYKFCDFYT